MVLKHTLKALQKISSYLEAYTSGHFDKSQVKLTLFYQYKLQLITWKIPLTENIRMGMLDVY